MRQFQSFSAIPPTSIVGSPIDYSPRAAAASRNVDAAILSHPENRALPIQFLHHAPRQFFAIHCWPHSYVYAAICQPVAGQIHENGLICRHLLQEDVATKKEPPEPAGVQPSRLPQT